MGDNGSFRAIRFRFARLYGLSDQDRTLSRGLIRIGFDPPAVANYPAECVVRVLRAFANVFGVATVGAS